MLLYKSGVEASGVHVVLNVPASSGCQRGNREFKRSVQQWNELWLFVRSRLGLLSTADLYLPPYPLPSHRPETATSSAPMGNGEFSLPPPKNIFLSKTSFHRHIITNIVRNVPFFINRKRAERVTFFVSFHLSLRSQIVLFILWECLTLKTAVL